MSSLHHLLSSFGLILQERLFPALEQKWCEKLSPRHKDFVAILGLVQLDGVVGTQHGRGRRRHDRAKIARALVAKAVWALPTTRSLLDRLGCDACLRLLCGWESDGDVPDETVFSRAFAEFANSELPQRIHAAVVKRTLANQLIGHIARDASAIEARQRVQRKTTLATPKIKSRPKRNSAEPKPLEKMTRVERQCSGRLTLKQICDELPRQCDAGCKNNSRGNKSVWVGYKLHLDVSDGHIPISALLTAASLHDSQAAVRLR